MSQAQPSKAEEDSRILSSSDQTKTRAKIVEILASTANGCISELGYKPAMTQALKELDARNKQWQMENIKLFEDNRTLAHLLQVKNGQLNNLDSENKRLSRERDHFRDLWEGKQLGHVVPAIEYQRLRAEYEQILVKYKFWKQEFGRMQGAMNAMIAQNHAQNAMMPPGGVPSSFPPTPTPVVPSQESNFQGHYPYPQPSQYSLPHPHQSPYPQPNPQGPHPAQIQLHPRPRSRPTPSQQVPVHALMQTQKSFVARRPPPQPQPAPTGSSQQRRPSDYRSIQPRGVSDDKSQVIAQARENGIVDGVAQSVALVHKYEAPSPHLAQTAPSSNNVIPMVSQPIPIQAPADQLPLNAVPLNMQNSVFVKQQTSPHRSPVPLHSTPPPAPVDSSESQIPPAGNALLLVPGSTAPASPERASASAGPSSMPELSISPCASPKSSSPTDPSEVSTPGGTIHDSTKVVSSPVIGMDSVKRVRDESDDAEMEDGSRKKQRVEEQSSDVTQPVEDEGNEEEDEEEDEAPIEVGPDGLRTEKSCLAVLFTADDNNQDLKNCALCQGRYELGAIQELPKPFEGASEAELIQHCITEHFDAWDALRHDVN